MPLTVRIASADEAEVLGRIGYAAWSEGEHGALDAGRADRSRLLADYQAFCREKVARILVAEDDAGRPLGWGAREDGDNYVSDLWVDPPAQRRGVGAALLGAMERDIAAAGYDHVHLETRAGATGAIRFYERNGYVVFWRKDKFTEALGYAIDKVGLRKLLTV